MNTLVGLLTLAYVSPLRAEMKKKNDSWRVQSGGTLPMEKGGLGRVEIRMTEFRDFPTYRTLDETQALTAGMFMNMREEFEDEISDPAVLEMSKVWTEAEVEFKNLLKKYKVTEDIDALLNSAKGTDDREKLVRYLKNDELRAEARGIVARTAREIKASMKEKVVETA